ncbi:hypothetical protein [Tissierella praeacuta]|uniref:hypothetical protein n=1 Tax=Tissierella praeacuta TaxID=43131 RepID=UPI003342134E
MKKAPKQWIKRKLSEQTGNATKSIEGILNNIQIEVEATKGSMVESEEALNDANKTLELVKEGFEGIYAAILAIKSISSVTEETAASMQEQSATMDTISSNTDNLARIIEKLNELVNRFKL